jgi:hypothetical protein
MSAALPSLSLFENGWNGMSLNFSVHEPAVWGAIKEKQRRSDRHLCEHTSYCSANITVSMQPSCAVKSFRRVLPTRSDLIRRLAVTLCLLRARCKEQREGIRWRPWYGKVIKLAHESFPLHLHARWTPPAAEGTYLAAVPTRLSHQPPAISPTTRVGKATRFYGNS